MNIIFIAAWRSSHGQLRPVFQYVSTRVPEGEIDPDKSESIIDLNAGYP
jgi:hypothetical protein